MISLHCEKLQRDTVGIWTAAAFKDKVANSADKDATERSKTSNADARFALTDEIHVRCCRPSFSNTNVMSCQQKYGTEWNTSLNETLSEKLLLFIGRDARRVSCCPLLVLREADESVEKAFRENLVHLPQTSNLRILWEPPKKAAALFSTPSQCFPLGGLSCSSPINHRGAHLDTPLALFFTLLPPQHWWRPQSSVKFSWCGWSKPAAGAWNWKTVTFMTFVSIV